MQRSEGTSLPPPTVWVPQIELRSAGLEHHACASAPLRATLTLFLGKHLPTSPSLAISRRHRNGLQGKGKQEFSY